MAPEQHLLEKIKAAPLENFPFPHLYLRDVFPIEFYQLIRENLPAQERMPQIGLVRGGKLKRYKERFAYLVGEDHARKRLPDGQRAFWDGFIDWLSGGGLAAGLLERFGIESADRRFKTDIHLVRDEAGYSLGPHTDATKKVVTALFYLPRDGSQSHLGTSLYIPKDPGFTDPLNQHHAHGDFRRVNMMPYLPNSLFAFARSDTSFHGVEPTDGQRWSLTFQIQNA